MKSFPKALKGPRVKTNGTDEVQSFRIGLDVLKISNGEKVFFFIFWFSWGYAVLAVVSVEDKD